MKSVLAIFFAPSLALAAQPGPCSELLFAPGLRVPTSTTTYLYGSDGRVQRARHLVLAGELREWIDGYTYDNQGRLARINDAFGYTEYQYSLDGKLSSTTRFDSNVPLPSTDVVYAYDAKGRKISERRRTTTTDEDVTVKYEYDAQGRVARELGPMRVTEYAYDAAGRLASSSTRTGSQPPEVVRYLYDADGNLVEKWEPGSRVEYDWSCWKKR